MSFKRENLVKEKDFKDHQRKNPIKCATYFNGFDTIKQHHPENVTYEELNHITLSFWDSCYYNISYTTY